MFTTLPSLSLYIHIPWCVRKCPYCDFNSHKAGADKLPESEYLSQLLLDLDRDLSWVQGRELESIFIGGGTPSLMSGHFYKQLLSAISQRITFATDIEITMEANPGAVEASKFEGYRQAGINRLSLGVQSFQDDKLEALGRIHSSSNAKEAVSILKKAGFNNFNIDLMHGLPNQTKEDALFDLSTAIDLKPTHLSWYQLTIEPNTEFFSAPPILPEEDTLIDIIEQGQALIAQSGYQQYEVSAYAQAGKRSRHNMNYWQFGDYLAIGAGAHGKITQPNGEIIRYRKVRQPNHYLDNNRLTTTAAIDPISKDDLPLEFLMNTLRLTNGFSMDLYQKTTGCTVDALIPRFERAVSEGLLEWEGSEQQFIRPTDKGRIYLNELLERFLN